MFREKIKRENNWENKRKTPLEPRSLQPRIEEWRIVKDFGLKF